MTPKRGQYGNSIRAERSKQRAATLKQRVFYGAGNGGDGLPVTNLSRPGGSLRRG